MSELSGRRVRMLVFRPHDRVARAWRESEVLAQAGASVEIFLLRQEGQRVVTEPGARIRIVRPTSFRPDSRKPWQAIRAYAAFARAIGREPADVYHCLDGATLPLGVVLARRDRARLVYDAADYFADHLPALPSQTLTDRLRRRYSPHYLWEMLLIRRSDVRITVSEGLARLLATRYRLPRVPTVVPNSAAYFRPTDRSRALLRTAVGADPSERLVVFIGSVHNDAASALEGDRHRGLDVLVDAVALLPHAHLVVIGAAPDQYRAALLERAQRAGADTRVSFLGLRSYPEYVELASGGDVGVYLTGGRPQTASYANTLPNRLFDFIMARLPVVVGAGTTTARVVRDFEIGTVLDRLDAAAVAAAIDEITSASRQRFADNLERAARDLCWEQQSVRLLEVYSELSMRSELSETNCAGGGSGRLVGRR